MARTDILQRLGKERLYFDGATGTELQKMGLVGGESPELMNITSPETVEALHRAYFASGADIVKTNTFGANVLKFENYEEIIKAALASAVRARADFPEKYVAFDVGPTGKMLEPLGDLSFEGAVEIFAKSVRAAENLGADLILIETMSDTLETKAAVIAAKENSNLPIFVTNVYDATGKMLTGASPEVAVAMLEGLGVSAIGMNCSLGPDKMAELLPRFVAAASVPLIANPNAGLPEVTDGKVSYSFDEQTFTKYMKTIAPYCAVLGGCCGTSPSYIRALKDATKDVKLEKITEKSATRVASFAKIADIGCATVLVGERLNPTGKPKLKEALRTGNMSYILDEAVKQAEAGAHVLDVNVGLPDIDECAKMREVVLAVQSVSDLPLQIDTANPEALAAAMRIYNGKPLVNSVNGSAASMNAVFPLVKKYGGAVIALTLDERGIPETAQERVEIAHKIIRRAAEYGIDAREIIVDPLALAISADSTSALTTLKAIKILHGEGVRTSLGVSNISFGLPRRDLINSTFFASALAEGLDVAIINPCSESMMSVYYANEALFAKDASCARYVAYATALQEENPTVFAKPTGNTEKNDDAQTLRAAIVRGLKEKSAAIASDLITKLGAMEIIEGEIIPALDEVGTKFERAEIFLPALLTSAEAASAAFEVAKKHVAARTVDAGSLVIATVEGDMHDIGKNIVKVILESHGFVVHDLGRNVSPDEILKAVERTGVSLVGLSALMTTTVPAMQKTIELLRKRAPGVQIMVGGAVMNPEYAAMIGADFYAADAMGAVSVCKNFFEKK